MKPLYNCPYCGCCLKEVTHNFAWFQKVCPYRCCIDYSQFYIDSFEGELQYISFNTPDFKVYAYFEKGHYPNTALIYSRNELNKSGKAGPCLKIPVSKIDTAFLESIESGGRYCNVGARDWASKLNDKLKMLLLFS